MTMYAQGTKFSTVGSVDQSFGAPQLRRITSALPAVECQTQTTTAAASQMTIPSPYLNKNLRLGSTFIPSFVSIPKPQIPPFTDADGIPQFFSSECRPLLFTEQPSRLYGKERQLAIASLRFGPGFASTLDHESALFSAAAVSFWNDTVLHSSLSSWLCECWEPEFLSHSSECANCGFQVYQCPDCQNCFLTRHERSRCINNHFQPTTFESLPHAVSIDFDFSECGFTPVTRKTTPKCASIDHSLPIQNRFASLEIESSSSPDIVEYPLVKRSVLRPVRPAPFGIRRLVKSIFPEPKWWERSTVPTADGSGDFRSRRTPRPQKMSPELLQILHLKNCASAHPWHRCHYNSSAKRTIWCVSCFGPRNPPSQPMPDGELPEADMFKFGINDETKIAIEEVINCLNDVKTTGTHIAGDAMDRLDKLTQLLTKIAEDGVTHNHTFGFGHSNPTNEAESSASLLSHIASVGPSIVCLILNLFWSTEPFLVRVINCIPAVQVILPQLSALDIQTRISELFTTPDDIPGAAGASLDPGLVMRLFAFLSGIKLSFRTIKDFMLTVGAVPRFIDGCSALLDYVSCCARWFIDLIRVKVFRLEPVFVDRASQLISSIIEKCDEFLAGRPTSEEYGPTYVASMYSAYLQALKCQEECLRIRVPKKYLDLLNSRVIGMAALTKSYSAISVLSTPRTPPLFVYLWGGSQIGKSTAIHYIQIDVAKIDADMDPHSYVKNIYMRFPEQEYHDGATNESLVEYYDDFGQLFDSKEKPDPSLLEFIRLGNIIPYPRHMADVGEKGKVFARPRLVLATSNTAPGQLNIQSLTCPAAFRNRLDLEFEVRNEIPRGVSLKEHQTAFHARTGETVDLSIYRFRGTVNGSVQDLTYQEFVTYLSYRYKERLLCGQGYQSSLDSYADTAFPSADLTAFGIDNASDIIGAVPSADGIGDSADSASVSPASRERLLRDAFRAFNISENDARAQLLMKNLCPAVPRPPREKAIAEILRLWNAFDPTASDFPFRPTICKSLCEMFPTPDLTESICLKVICNHSVCGPENPVNNWLNGNGSSKWWIMNTLAALNPFIAAVHANSYLQQLLENLSSQQLHHVIIPVSDDAPHTVSAVMSCVQAFGSSGITEFIPFFRRHPCYAELRRLVCHGTHRMVLDFVEKVLATDDVLYVKFVLYCCDFVSKIDVEPTYTEPPTTTFSKVRNSYIASAYAWGASLGSKFPTLSILFIIGCIGVVAYSTVFVWTSAVTALRAIWSLCSQAYPTADSLGLKSARQGRVPVSQSLGIKQAGVRKVAIADGFDLNSHQVAKSAIRNIASLRVVTGSTTLDLNGLFVKGRCMITYLHGLNAINDAIEEYGLETAQLLNASGELLYNIRIADLKFVVRDNDKTPQYDDRAMIIFPRYVAAFRDVSKSFVPASRILECQDYPLTVTTPVTNRHASASSILLQTANACTVFTNGVYSLLGEKKYTTLVKYEAFLEAGDCGSPLVTHNPRLPGKLLGLHIAHTGSSAYGVPWTQECVDSFLSLAEETATSFSIPEMHEFEVPEASAPLPLEGSFGFNSTLVNPVSACSASSFRRSPISGVLAKSAVKPAHLRPVEIDGVFQDPMFKSLSKAGTVCPLIDPEHLENAVRDVADVMFSASSIRDAPLTVDQAVHGIDGDLLYPSLTLSTSPGYPATLSKAPKHHGKTSWITHPTPTTEAFIAPELRAEVLNLIECASRGQRLPVLWLDFAKDETRPIAKVDQLKTRSVNCSPLAFTIACRIVFGRFCAAKIDGKISNGTAAGINPYGIEWTHLASHLLEVGDNAIAGDYGTWDGSQSSMLMWAALDTINRWYDHCADEREAMDCLFDDPWYAQHVTNFARTTLFHEIVFSIHVYRDFMYMWLKSMPSGTYLTEVVNTINNNLIVRLAWQAQGPSFSMRSFRQNVRLVALGDDHVVTVAQPFISSFNQTHLQVFAETLGMTYTDESKSDRRDLTVRPISEVGFLKRSFTWDQRLQRYLGQLEFASIAENFNWLRKTLPVKVALNLNAECAFRELSLYPRELYNECLEKVDRAFVRTGLPPPCVPSWSQNRHLCVDLGQWVFANL